MQQVQSVILDIDGTLIDSNDAHAKAWVRALERNDIHVPFEQVRPLIGMGGDKVLPEVAGTEKESEKGKRISSMRKQIFLHDYVPHLRAFPKTRELLQHLREQRLRLAIATSAEPDELQTLLRVIDTQASKYFEEQTSSQDASQSKPDPDIINATLQRSGFDPAHTLMFGDTAYDIEAAGKAGIKTIAFRCGGWSDKDLQGAIAIYNDPANLLAHFDTSPLKQGF
ncbi:HAD family hydrolase [Ktedonospora formicarum]|uniref:Phosphoglycolate phosphatase n=1 Tax=Ktedonospora formicarum TaxID=2778364 RepID=A0A8J3HX69_9CHLR|nr:HAD family hydrolase [Ktedonospora formicarum]GHO44886.1 phosphoglycolate phosphatase [Ktedonospora formicarum]